MTLTDSILQLHHRSIQPRTNKTQRKRVYGTQLHHVFYKTIKWLSLRKFTWLSEALHRAVRSSFRLSLLISSSRSSITIHIIDSLHDVLLLLSCVLHCCKLVSNATAFLHFYDDLCCGNNNKRINKITRNKKTKIRIAYLNYFMACHFFTTLDCECVRE